MSEINALIEGFKQFKQQYIEDPKSKYGQLSQYGAHSKILMIACCDSRVDPAIITHSDAGDLMVIRNIANLVPAYNADSQLQETQAAIQFAVCYLNIEQIIVMGHSRCGGIRSLLTRLVDDSEPEQALDKWTSVAEPAARQVLTDMPKASLDDQACACSRKAIAASLENLKSYPWIADKIIRQHMNLHGWYFNLANGDLEEYNSEQETFHSLLSA